jgi:hypothetical protein
MTVSTKLEPQLDKTLLGKHQYHSCHYDSYIGFHPSNGATAQIGPWRPLLRFRNKNVLQCEVVSLMTNPR